MNTEETLLAQTLALAVPLLITEIAQRGGPTDEDYARIASYTDDLAVHGDDLLYASRKPGETARRFQQVAEAIAVLSFCPGGITVFGLHFEAGSSPAKPRQAIQ
jgi:hypothetical protein